jgi:CRP/FNR family transcriptional regulator, cyclic AMP receptor protein
VLQQPLDATVGVGECLAALGAPLHRFRRAELLVRAQEPAACLYVVRAGCVRTYRLREDGSETTTALSGPGALVGLAVLVGQPVYQSFAEALTPVEVWALHVDRLHEALRRDTRLQVAFVGALVERLWTVEALLRDVKLLPVPARVRNARNRLERAFGGSPPRLTRGALAALVGSSRESVSRVVNADRGASSRSGVDLSDRLAS